MTLTTDERITKLKAAAWAFREELAAMGMDFAAVVIDPHLQTTSTAHLLYVGSLLKASAGKAFETWLRFVDDPACKMSMYEEITVPKGQVQ